MIDLHTHSVFSDGTLTPEELVAAGLDAGLAALALTDHDTTAGLPRFLAAARENGLRAVPGVEISADYGPGTMHLLGYFVPAADPAMETTLARIREGREARNRHILARLAELGCALAWDEVAALAGGEVVGRPHFAQALVARGWVKDRDAAFRRYLAKGKPAYVGRAKLSPVDSIRLIAAAGGVAVLAHPFSLRLGPRQLHERVAELRDAGLAGVEVWYPEHNRVRERQYRRLASDLGLVATGGTDYHGANSPDLALGRGFGNLCIPESVVEELQARRKS